MYAVEMNALFEKQADLDFVLSFLEQDPNLLTLDDYTSKLITPENSVYSQIYFTVSDENWEYVGWVIEFIKDRCITGHAVHMEHHKDNEIKYFDGVGENA